MANDFNRTLGQIETSIRRIMNEKDVMRRRKNQLALHELATNQQNARSDRLRDLSKQRQETINRGIAVSQDLRRGHDITALNQGRMSQDEFNNRWGTSGKQSTDTLSSRDLAGLYKDYMVETLKNPDPDVKPMSLRDFSNTYLSGMGQGTPLQSVGNENDIIETTPKDAEYGGRSYIDRESLERNPIKPVEQSAEEVFLQGPNKKKVVLANGAEVDATRAPDGNFYIEMDGKYYKVD
ncbi:MAG: hypothetical protein SVO01_00130 [Thermotogota bacterium]|nr:hypothetical protein [Thermotogota bacterium]